MHTVMSKLSEFKRAVKKYNSINCMTEAFKAILAYHS